MQSPPKFPRKQVILLSIAFFTCLLLILFNSCKKNELTQTATIEQVNDFFKPPSGISPETKAVIDAMRKQLNAENVKDFLNWHGQPSWDKAIKLVNKQYSSATYLIPVNKGAQLNAFIAATIQTTGKVLFELHRKSTQLSKVLEYSYVNIGLGKSRFFLNYFDGITTKAEQVASASPKDGNLMPEEYCWYEWETVPCGNQLIAPPQECHGWVQHCETDDGGGSGGSGGGGGGGCSDCYPPDCFSSTWYNLIPLPPDECDPPYNPHNATRIEVDSSIYNNFPCLDTLLQNIPNANQVTQELLHNTFGVNIYSNLTFQIDWTLDSTTSTNAYTTPGKGSLTNLGNFYFFDTIKLNPWVVKNASKEYMIGTIFHEAVHSYIRYRYSQWEHGIITDSVFLNEFALFWPNFTDTLNATELIEHQQMAFSYVAQISSVVEQYFNPLASNVLKTRVSNSIAWEGLRESTMWKLPGLDTCRITRENIAARNTSMVYHIPAYGACSSATVRYDSLGLSLPCH